MQGSRPERVGEQIRDELSALVAREVKDPGIGFVTFTYVKVSADLQNARVYYTALGDDRARRETARALARATPFLRRQVASRLRLRRAPEIAFTWDESIARAERIEQIIQDLHATRPAPDEPGPGDDQP